MSDMLIPAFQSEKEEADWLYENREARDEEFARAIQEGRAHRSTTAERVAKAQESATLALAGTERAEASEFARRRGMSVETYLRTLVLEGLARERNTAR